MCRCPAYYLNGQMTGFLFVCFYSAEGKLGLNYTIQHRAPVLSFGFDSEISFGHFSRGDTKSRSLCSNWKGRWWVTFPHVCKLSFYTLSGWPLLVAKFQFNSRLNNELRCGNDSPSPPGTIRQQKGMQFLGCQNPLSGLCMQGTTFNHLSLKWSGKEAHC